MKCFFAKSSFIFFIVAMAPFFVAAQGIGQGVSSDQLQKQIQDLLKQIELFKTQIAVLQTQIKITGEEVVEVKKEVAEVREELKLTRSFQRGDRGPEVEFLQKALSQLPDDIYPEKLVTGFFGSRTEEAIRRLQKKQDIVSSGDSSVTGYGRVGPKTIAKINELLAEGAGQSGKVPPGLLTAPGLQNLPSAVPTIPVTSAVPATPAIPATLATPLVGSGGSPTSVTPATPATSAAPASPSSGGSPVAPDTISPSTPTNLIAAANAFDVIALAWTASTDNSAVTGYKVYRNGSFLTSVTAISYRDNGLIANTTYTYTVAAYDAAGNISSQSNSASAITLASSSGGAPSTQDGTPPVISNVQVSNITDTSAVFTWTTNEYATSQLYYSINSGVSVATNYPITADSGTITADSGTDHAVNSFHLAGGRIYYYVVVSKDNSGNQSVSSERTFTTSSSLPDLTVVFTNPPPASVAAGSDLTFPVSISNTGTANVGSFSALLTFGDVTKTMTQSTLLAGNVLGSYFQVTAPSIPGSYTVMVNVDPNNTVKETNENNNSVSVVINVISSGPPAPTNFDGATSGDITSRPPRIGLYIVWNYTLQSTTKSFNVYMKKPSDAAFVKYTYDANTSVVPGWLPLPEGTTPKLYHNETNGWMWRIYDQVADTVWEIGEYKFYATTVDVNGTESVPTATKSFKFYRAPTIVSPADGSVVSATPRITITEDPAAVHLGLALYQQTSNWINVPGWWPAPRDFTYSGPTLTANGNPHRLVAYSTGGSNERSLNSVSTFSVAASDAAALIHQSQLASLASILKSLTAVLLQMQKLIR